MGISLAQFSTLVSGVHDAALDASLWDRTLNDLATAFEGGCGALMINSGQSRHALNASIGRDHSAVASYNTYYSRIDPMASAVRSMHSGSIVRGWDIVTPGAGRSSEFFNDWGRPNGLGDCILATIERDDDKVAWLGIGAPFRSEPFAGRDKMRLMRLLLPHLRTAMRVRARLGEIENLPRGALEAFDRLAHGVVLFDRKGSVVFANQAAARIATSADGVTIGRTGIRTALAEENAVLHRLVDRALGKEPGPRASGTVALSRPSARQPLVVHVLPTGDGDLPMSCALVLIVDPEREPRGLAPLLRRIYGLTRAEATVACEVLRGVGLQAVADNMSVTLSTVRVHLQRVFEKTHTHRQAEMARLLLTIEAAIETDDGLT